VTDVDLKAGIEIGCWGVIWLGGIVGEVEKIGVVSAWRLRGGEQSLSAG
jgi:hypothetical protein